MMPCCAKPENMRTSYPSSKRAAHDEFHTSPGIWSDAPQQNRHNHYYCFKCPGARGAGMYDFVRAPFLNKTKASAPFHAHNPSEMRARVHVERGLVPRKLTAVSKWMKGARIILASKGLPHVTPPPECSLYGVTYSPDTAGKKCKRKNCPINLKYGEHTWSIFTEHDERSL